MIRHSRNLAFLVRLLPLVLALCGAGPAATWAQQPSGAPMGSTAEDSPDDKGRNVYSAGGQIQPEAPVRGDFTAAGGRVVVTQPVAGDAALAGGAVDVRAPIGEDLRVGAGDVRIENAVGGELMAMGGNITLTPTARVGGNATLYAGDLDIRGRIEQGLDARARRIVLNAEVGGDARLAGEQIELGPDARVRGALRYTSPNALKMDEGARVTGALTREQSPTQARRAPAREANAPMARGASWVAGALFFLGLLAFAAVFLLVAPLLANRSADQIKTSPWLALALGLATAVAVPVLAALLFITVLGIPLGLLVLSLYPVLLLLGLLLGVLFIAHLLGRALRRAPGDTFALNLLFFALALLVVLLLANVPFAGGLVIALLTLAGLGALLLEIRDRRRPRGLPPGR